ncbi:uncharacterized protein LOC117329007 [Pecten maximus]|uniref:uncharacterized protein LOC117329007 n=1 Tax=Pecten maximus TaxID=6579 RepID=UPI0014586B7F|nr:uncharacterized protein LOC117329007 [Pecten maximus]
MQEQGRPVGSSDFTILSGNDGFSNRCKDVFSCLQTLEDKHVAHDKSISEEGSQHLLKADPTVEDTETISRKFKKPDNLPSPRNSTSRLQKSHEDERKGLKRPSSELYVPPYKKRGDNPESDNKSSKTDSDFKLPPQRFPNQRKNKVPDFKLNPNKWKKYTLEDVSNEDMSQAANTQAAFAFLEERRKLREAADGKEEEVKADVEGGACSQGAIVFKRPTKKGGNKQDSVSTKIKSDKNCDNFDGDDDLEDESLIIKPSVTFKSKKNKSQRNLRKKETEDDD